MRALVIGGGVVGATTAHALAGEGIEVTLVDRAERAAAEASGVNAGLVAPAHTLSWNHPRILRDLPSILGGRHPHMRVHEPLQPALLAWGATFLWACRPTVYRSTTLVRAALARRSLAELLATVEREGIACDLVRRGALFVHEDPRALARLDADLEILSRRGHDVRLLDAAQCRDLEPALGDAPLAGAVLDADAVSGDCAAFTRSLLARDAARGMRLRLGQPVSLRRRGNTVQAAVTAEGEELRADVYVLAAGAQSPALLGERVPGLRITPVRGHGLTWHGVDDGVAPRMPGVDEQARMGWGRYGTRLRVTGGADFAGGRVNADRTRVAEIAAAAHRRFPGLAEAGSPTVGVGLRALTPDGLPRVGRVGNGNLWINVGHGNLGWTLASGCASLLADALLGRALDPALAGLAPRRGLRSTTPAS